jgi:MFS transporter, PAT family, beta-lactamase induction signal transducer AmpG
VESSGASVRFAGCPFSVARDAPLRLNKAPRRGVGRKRRASDPVVEQCRYNPEPPPHDRYDWYDMDAIKRVRHPASWVPTSYLAEGIPFAMVTWVSGTMFKDLGYTDGQITLSTASIGLAWSLKPLWAGFLDMYRTKKLWVISMEFVLCGLLAIAGLALQLPSYFTVVLGTLWVLAFASATQDIVVDGVYITALSKGQQATWIGVQGVSWNAGRLFATSILVGSAHVMEKYAGMEPKTAWTGAMLVGAVTMAILGIYHSFVLPVGPIKRRPSGAKEIFAEFWDEVRTFFQKKSIGGMLIFVFLYRSGEGFLLQEAPLFIQAPLKDGGVGLTLGQKALIDGTVSNVMGVVAGILAGLFIARFTLRRTLLFLALCMNVPHLCYIFLSQAVTPDAPLPLSLVMALVAIEKFGYGFGFTGNMLYMMQQLAPGTFNNKYKMTHYAFATSLMNLVLLPTQASSGWLADRMGYRHFFVFVLVASIPSVIAAWKAPFPDPPDVDEGDESTSRDVAPR